METTKAKTFVGSCTTYCGGKRHGPFVIHCLLFAFVSVQLCAHSSSSSPPRQVSYVINSFEPLPFASQSQSIDSNANSGANTNANAFFLPNNNIGLDWFGYVFENQGLLNVSSTSTSTSTSIDTLMTDDAIGPDTGTSIISNNDNDNDNDIDNKTEKKNLPLFGHGALQIHYQTQQARPWGGFVTFGHILQSKRAHNCIGATHLSLWYKIIQPQSLPGRAHLRIILLDDSNCVAAASNNNNTSTTCNKEQDLEQYYSFHHILDGTNINTNTDADTNTNTNIDSDFYNDWKELTIELQGDNNPNSPFWRSGWSGQIGNDRLDLDHIKGWRLEINIDSKGHIGNITEGILLVDHLACIGSGELIGAALQTTQQDLQDNDNNKNNNNNNNKTDTFQQAIDRGDWMEEYFQSPLSQNQSQITLNDGILDMNYTVQQTQSWGGFINYFHLAPDVAYYNLSLATDISLDYHVKKVASNPNRVHLRLILLDSSDCEEQCNMTSDTENYYSFHHILDETTNKTETVVVRLEGDSDAISPFTRPGWIGIVGNDILDKSNIKGYRLELNLNSQGEIGSLVSGNVQLSNLRTESSSSSSSPFITVDKGNGNANANNNSIILINNSSTSTSAGADTTGNNQQQQQNQDPNPNQDPEAQQCSLIPGMFIGFQDVKRFEFLGRQCCQVCSQDPDCLYFQIENEHCFTTSSIHVNNVSLVESSFTEAKFTTFWQDSAEKRGDYCQVCTCHRSGDGGGSTGDAVGTDSTSSAGPDIIDCRGRDLRILPKTLKMNGFNPSVLDLTNNPRLVVLGPNAFSEISNTLQELRLPSNLRYLLPETLQALPLLRTVSFENTDNDREMKQEQQEQGQEKEQEEKRINSISSFQGNASSTGTSKNNHNLLNAISAPNAFYGDICCGKGTRIDLDSPPNGLTFCDITFDKPGIDAIYEEFIEYSFANHLEILRPSSSFLSEAAESPEKCAEFCAIRDGCLYFSFDGRHGRSDNVCFLLTSTGIPNSVCCQPGDYADEAQTKPGWISGRVPRTRHIIDNARLLISPQNLVVDTNNEFKTTFFVSLGSMPIRGAVWVTPTIASNTKNAKLVFEPEQVVLYDNTTKIAINIIISNIDSLSDSTAHLNLKQTSTSSFTETIVIINNIQACDAAFRTPTHLLVENTVYLDLILPNNNINNNTNRSLIVIVVVVSVSVVLLFVGIIFYIDRRRRQADSIWRVERSELHFGDPPEIVGRGTFGLVLLAEYRGTMVAVKRVIPPRIIKKGGGGNDNKLNLLSTLFDAPPIELFDDISSEDLDTLADKERSSLIQQQRLGSGTMMAPIPALLSSVSSGGLSSTVFSRASSGGQPLPVSSLPRFSSLQGESQQYDHSTNKATETNKSGSNMWGSNRDDYARLKADFIEEMRHLSKLRHPCITTVMGAVIGKKEEPMLVMEYMDHGSLYDLIHNDTMVVDADFILPILRDIGQGVRFLHAASPQVIHGDLKAQNILVDSKFRAKVADFGLSQKKQLGATGTPFWMAPELLRGETRNTTASDVYSFGIILYELYSRQEPYEGEDYIQVLQLISNPKINKRPPVPSSCPSEMRYLMRDCLSGDPNQRPTFEQIDQRMKTMDAANVQPGQIIFSKRINNKAAASDENNNSKRTNELLFEVFPRHIAEALRDGRKVEPESRDIVTIFFSDIVGFTSISSSLTPIKISDMLDRLYNKFDELSRQHDVFKVETIGDAYMAVTNLIKDQPDHTSRIAKFAVDAMEAAKSTPIDLDDAELGCVRIRVGFHSGPVVANVVGSRNPRYCLFGDTVNTASRMESNSMENRIHCSEAAAILLREQDCGMKIRSRGRINVKGKGDMQTYWVNEGSTSLCPARVITLNKSCQSKQRRKSRVKRTQSKECQEQPKAISPVPE